jgi:primosomal protein N' (replication factor Y)
VHSSLSKKKIAEVWTEAIQNERSVVIITTPHFMSIPRHDIETLIVESESSRGYRTFNSPLFDWKKLIENYSKELGARLVYGDTFLSLDTIYRVHNHEIYEIFPLSYRIQQDAEVILIDMVEAKQKTGKYSVLSEELVSMIEYAQKKNQQIFIFASRRGLSPQTICSDCGKTVICKVCKAPVVLHKTNKGERYFLCHHCGKDRSALEACSKCASWNLTTIGIGSDTVYEEVKKLFPETPLFRLDKDNAKGDKEAKKITKEFSESKGGVLIGTETALSYIEKVKLVAVASMDNLFSIPDFRINERIAHICMRLFEIAESYLLIQSRKTDTEILRAMNSKTLADFVKEELAMREMLSYPPYTLMGKVELSGDLDTITKQAKKIETLLADQDPLIFPAVIPNKRGSALHLLFTLPKDIWEKETRIHTELYQKLVLISKISPVLINPESFL